MDPTTFATFFDNDEEELIFDGATFWLIEEKPLVAHGGSRPGRRPNVERECVLGHERIFRDYFAADPVYNELQFRRRFRMSRQLFLRLVDAVQDHDAYFIQKRDATGKLAVCYPKGCCCHAPASLWDPS